MYSNQCLQPLLQDRLILDLCIFLEENRTGVNYLMSKSLSSLKRYRAYTKSKANKLQLKHRSELHT